MWGGGAGKEGCEGVWGGGGRKGMKVWETSGVHLEKSPRGGGKSTLEDIGGGGGHI